MNSNSRLKNVVTSVGILVLSVMGILFLWENGLLLSVILLCLTLIKYSLIPIKKELLWYSIVTVAGYMVEILLVNVGGAWSYSARALLGVPIWMPLFWGVVGTTVIVFYQNITE